MHLLVERPSALDGALVDKAGGALQLLRGGGIDIVGGAESPDPNRLTQRISRQTE
jgi:hypothetical protein